MSFKRKAIAVIISIIVLIIGYNVATFKMKRSFNYSIEYEAKVEQTAKKKICEMVKKEHLKKPEDCE